MSPYEIISFISLIGVIYLIFLRTKDQKESKPKEVEPGGTYLPPIKKIPEPHSVDPDLRLLKDVIKTCKLESWKPTIKMDYSISSCLYEINIENPSGTLRIKGRVRHNTDQDQRISPTRVVGFFIMDVANNGNLSYADHELANVLCLEFLWNDYIIPHHQSEHDAQLEYYLSVKKSIDSKLVTLRRDKSLEDILKQD